MPQGSDIAVGLDRRESAMRSIDEAVRAKYEGRLDDAVLSASDARRADPRAAGADVIIAEIALAQRKYEIARQSAARALQQGLNKSAAELLLAMSEAATRGFADGGNLVGKLLEQAEEAELSNPSVQYVRGEMLRMAGREEEAQQKLLGSLHRQEPWMSSTIIAAKLQLASAVAEEAGDRSGEARRKIVPSKAGDAMVAVHGALRSGGDLLEPLQQLWANICAHQAKEFLDDPVFDVSTAPTILEEARKAQPPTIPHSDLSQADPVGS